MNKYLNLKSKHEKEMNAFPMAFAFSNKQFEEAKKKLNVFSNDELLSIPGGGMIRKTDNAAFTKMYFDMNEESSKAMEDDEYLYEGILYELGNHEFCITYDPDDTLRCFSLTKDEVDKDERLSRIFTTARGQYLAGCNQ